MRGSDRRKLRPGSVFGKFGSNIVALALLSVAISAGPSTAPARAAEGDLTCQAKATFIFDPNPLSYYDTYLTPSGTVDLGANADTGTPCTSDTGATMSGGTFTLDPFGAVFSCTHADLTGTGAIAWNNGNPASSIKWHLTITVRGDRTLTAEVVAGPLQGDTLTISPGNVTADGDCAGYIRKLQFDDATITFQ